MLKRIIVVLMLAQFLVGCSQTVVVKATGNIATLVTIQFTDRQGVALSNFYLESVQVSRIVGESTEPIWRISGSQNVSQLNYGENPKGFRTDLSPRFLAKNSRYKIQITGRYPLGATSFGDAVVTVDQDGNVR